MKKTLIYLLLFPTLLSLWGCPGECVGPEYIFNTAIKVSPERDTVQLGDTLWLKGSIPDVLKDSLSKIMVEYRNAKVILSLQFIEVLKTDRMQTSLANVPDKFSFVSTIGRIYTPRLPTWRDIETAYIGNTYQYEVGIIPKEAGTFFIEAAHAGIANIESKKNRCEGAELYQHFDVKNINFHLLEPYNPQFPDGTRGIYAFIVIPKK